MNKSRLPHLLSPFDLRGLTLRNRVVMAPLTRARAGRERLPNELMAEYLSNPDLVERFAHGGELNPPAEMKV
jgi:hypothetical protein